mgnify:CR=1 FL=1
MSVLALLALMAGTGAWYLLAMLPAIRELMLKTDVRPLRIISDHDGHAEHFARRSLAHLRVLHELSLRAHEPVSFFGVNLALLNIHPPTHHHSRGGYRKICL